MGAYAEKDAVALETLTPFMHSPAAFAYLKPLSTALDGIPALAVTHVVHQPGGSLPTSCYPEQRLDMTGVLDYADAARDATAWPRWLAGAIAGIAR